MGVEDDKGAGETGTKDTTLAEKGADTGAKDTSTAGTILDTGTKDTGTVDDKGAGDGGTVLKTEAPDWRAKLAGDDKEALKRLARFPDEAALFKSFRSLEQKMSSGEYKKPLADNATPEEKATWRKENGLPEKSEAYVEALALPAGLVLGEADKPIVSELAAVALEGNMDPKAFNGLVTKYYQMQDAQRAKQEDADTAFKIASEEALRADWQGPDYRRNLTAVNNLIATWPEGLASRVLAGRTPDGRKLGDDPIFIRQLASLALELNPTATLVPAGTTDSGKTAQAELDEISKYSRDKPDEYNADKKTQARRLELTDALGRLNKRKAA